MDPTNRDISGLHCISKIRPKSVIGSVKTQKVSRCLSSVRSYGIHLRAIAQKIPKLSILGIWLQIENLILQPHLPGDNELK